MRIWPKTWVWFFAFLSVPVSGQVIGQVVRTDGLWCDKTHQNCATEKLQKMSWVYKDSQLIRPGKSEPQDFVEIRSRWGTLAKFDCSEPRELGCKEALNLSRLIPDSPQDSFWPALVDAVYKLAATQPKAYNSLAQGILITRGSPAGLEDGVVRLDEGKLAVNSVVKNLAAGTYLLELCRLTENEKPDCPSLPKTIDYDWEPDQAKPLQVGSIATGTYRLYLCDTQFGVLVRTRNYADMIVAAGADYRRLDQEFERIVSATKAWDRSDPTAPVMRRIYLHTLAAKP